MQFSYRDRVHHPCTQCKMFFFFFSASFSEDGGFPGGFSWPLWYPGPNSTLPMSKRSSKPRCTQTSSTSVSQSSEQ